MRFRRTMVCACLLTLSAGCSYSLNTALGTPKNPLTVYADPKSRFRDDDDKFVYAAYNVLLEAIDMPGGGAKPEAAKLKKVDANYDMRGYLSAGYTLSDLYCARYFRKSDETSRRRKFGRAMTNDAGTAITTVLGLVNAGKAAITAFAAGTGLADSSWRNYDDSFMISPELSSVQGLVEAAQDNYRARSLGRNAAMPADFSTAHHMIQRYANLCSHLGMRRLLQDSAAREQRLLVDDTDKQNGGTKGAPAGVPAAEPSDRPVTALPTPPANRPPLS